MNEYTELTINDLDKYYLFTNKFDAYSDINFVSLLSWSETTLYKLTDRRLSVIFSDYESDKKIITGITSDDGDTLLHEMYSIVREIPSISMDAVPAIVVNSLHEEQFREIFTLSEDHSDYLYKPSTQLRLDGKNFSWYRRKLSIFNRQNSEAHVHVDITPGIQATDILSLASLWQRWSNNVNQKEVDAIKRYIDLLPFTKDQYVLTVFLGAKPVAFSFVETVDCKNRTVLVHFFKSDNSYEGLSNFLFQEIAKLAKNQSAEYINFEQDVGEAGLRQYKQKLCPDKMLEKFTLKAR